MMVEMNSKLKKVMTDTTDKEKIRLFYELAKYITFDISKFEDEDEDIDNLFGDIINVINDIENL